MSKQTRSETPAVEILDPEVLAADAAADSGVVEQPAAAAAPTSALGPHMPAHSLAFNVQDIDIPRLNVIQKMSQIEGPVGSCVFDKETVLFEAGASIPVVILGATKRWKEDVPFDDDYMPKSVDTEVESRQLAAASDYEIIEYAEIVMLIPQVGDSGDFPYPIGDTNYQIGRITVQKDAYRLTYKRLITFQTFNRSVPVSSRIWNFGTELITKGKYSWYAPTLAITKQETPAEVGEFLRDLTAG
jgi:hypothetical protein